MLHRMDDVQLDMRVYMNWSGSTIDDTVALGLITSTAQRINELWRCDGSATSTPLLLASPAASSKPFHTKWNVRPLRASTLGEVTSNTIFIDEYKESLFSNSIDANGWRRELRGSFVYGPFWTQFYRQLRISLDGGFASVEPSTPTGRHSTPSTHPFTRPEINGWQNERLGFVLNQWPWSETEADNHNNW